MHCCPRLCLPWAGSRPLCPALTTPAPLRSVQAGGAAAQDRFSAVLRLDSARLNPPRHTPDSALVASGSLLTRRAPRLSAAARSALQDRPQPRQTHPLHAPAPHRGRPRQPSVAAACLLAPPACICALACLCAYAVALPLHACCAAPLLQASARTVLARGATGLTLAAAAAGFHMLCSCATDLCWYRNSLYNILQCAIHTSHESGPAMPQRERRPPSAPTPCCSSPSSASSSCRPPLPLPPPPPLLLLRLAPPACAPCGPRRQPGTGTRHRPPPSAPPCRRLHLRRALEGTARQLQPSSGPGGTMRMPEQQA